MQTAVRLLNQKGGIKSLGGKKLTLNLYDTQSSSSTAFTVTRKALDEGAIIVTGAAGSPESLVASQVCEESKVAYLTTTDFAPNLLTRGFKYMFQADPSMEAIAQATLQFVQQEGKRTGKPATRLGILATNDEVGAPSAQALQKLGPQYGFKVVATEEYPDGTTDFSTYLAKLRAAGADAVFGYQLTPDSIAIVNAMVEMRYQPIAFGGILGGETTTSYADSTGKNGNATLVASNFSPDLKIPGLPPLLTAYQNQWHQPISVNAASGVSAIGLIAAAIEAAGSTDPQKVRDALANINITAGENMFILLNGCKFNETGYNTRAQGVVQQIYGGAFHSVYPATYASDFTPKWPFSA
jgi:branched-chain amino acid transport system substrate-binding protein